MKTEIQKDLTDLENRIAQMTNVLTDYMQMTVERLQPLFDAVEKATALIEAEEAAQDATEAAETHDFREGELIVYVNGDTFQIGEIKRLCSDGAFVWYHEGDTASKTPFENMHKLQNAYCIKQTSLAMYRPRCKSCKNFCDCSSWTDVEALTDASRCDKYDMIIRRNEP